MGRLITFIVGTVIITLLLLVVWRLTRIENVSASPSLVAAHEKASEHSMMRVPTEGMSCAACAAKVKRKLSELPDVVGVDVDLMLREVRVSHTGVLSRQAVMSAISELGYTPTAGDDAKQTENDRP